MMTLIVYVPKVDFPMGSIFISYRLEAFESWRGRVVMAFSSWSVGRWYGSRQGCVASSVNISCIAARMLDQHRQIKIISLGPA